MAANDFYYGARPPTTEPAQHQQSQYYGTYQPSPSSTPAPSYHSVAGAHSSRPPQRADTVSPFDTVFDDPNYPPGDSTQDGFRHVGGAGGSYNSYGNHNMQQPGLYGNADTAYYGQQSVSPASSMPQQAHFADDIPLQNQGQGYGPNPPPKDNEMNDHVYDAPGRSSRRRGKSNKVGFGQLGMLGADRKRIPWVCYIFAAAQIGTFIGMIIRNALLTGSPIMINPTFNPMIGPSFYVMINMGARYVPCMHSLPEITEAVDQLPPGTPLNFPCPNTTTHDAQSPSMQCTLGELCGFGGVPNPVDPESSGEPNQWFRFILPMFLHAGLIHIAINMLVQLTLAKDMERAIGSVRFLLVYVSAGIFGNVLGANYAGSGEASTGASGALFGVIALTLLDLLYSWKDRRSPVKDLMFIILDVVICFVLGLLPGLDNFAHIGGFLMGLCLGVSVLHSPNALRRRLGYDTPYTTVGTGASAEAPPGFLKNPTGFFKGRKPLWWAWWIVRAAALVTVIVVFIVLLNTFYSNRNNCSWCKYLSCLPVNGWCELGELDIEIRDENGDPA